MKKFILKTLLFVMPFIAIHLINVYFYNSEEGDLIRVGYLYSNPSPKSAIVPFNLKERYFDQLSEIYRLTTKRNYRVLTIGDSFSEQKNLGYQNFLSEKGVKVLHIDRFLSGENPIQTLIALLNGDFFKHINTEYILLQCVERSFNERTELINWNHAKHIDEIFSDITGYKQSLPDNQLMFFSDATLKIPITNIEYLFTPKPTFSQTYKYKSKNSELFTNSPDNILFFQDEISRLGVLNNTEKTLYGIQVLNQLNKLAKEKGIKLIILISPDKYDLYYPHIDNKLKPQAPKFFMTYNKYPKQYRDINAFTILSNEISLTKDVYYYDDTHWTPRAAKLIAENIYKNLN